MKNKAQEPAKFEAQEPAKFEAQEPAKVEGRVLRDCALGRANEVVLVDSASDDVDTSPEAVAYAKSLAE